MEVDAGDPPEVDAGEPTAATCGSGRLSRLPPNARWERWSPTDFCDDVLACTDDDLTDEGDDWFCTAMSAACPDSGFACERGVRPQQVTVDEFRALCAFSARDAVQSVTCRVYL